MDLISIKCAECGYSSGLHETLTDAINVVEGVGGSFPLNSTKWTSCPNCFKFKKLYLSARDGKISISEVLIQNLLRTDEVFEVISVNAGKLLVKWIAKQKILRIGKEIFITREQFEELKGIA